MTNPRTQQFKVVAQTAVDVSQAVTQAAFFNADNTPYLFPIQQAAEANIATADGTDLATTQALANATKAKVNALLVKLRAAKILLP